MSFKCKIFGHKWSLYNEDVTHMIPVVSNPYLPAQLSLQQQKVSNIPSFTMMINKEFRICSRCYYKQRREKYTDNWTTHSLSTSELRDKKLDELGI